MISLMTILSIAEYVLMALGLSRIAVRRGIPNTWFAWIPILNLSLLGAVSDQYQLDTREVQKNKGKILPLLTFIPAIFTIILVSVAGGTGDLELAGAMLVLFVLVGVAAGILSIVMYYMALLDLYRSCSPENATLYTVISVLLPVTVPFFVFCEREKGAESVRASGYPAKSEDSTGHEKVKAYQSSFITKMRETASKGTRCPECGAFLQDAQTCCPFCGYRLTEAVSEPSVHESAPETTAEEHCAHCGEALEADDLFCPGCGRPVTRHEEVKKSNEGAKLNCPYCGESLAADDLFCPGCGRSLQDAIAAEAIGTAENVPEMPPAAIKTTISSLPEEKTEVPASYAAEKKLIIRRSSGKVCEDVFKNPEL